MAKPIEATPTLRGKEAEEFVRKMKTAEKLNLTEKEMKIIKNMIFMEDNKTPRCLVCGKAMHNVKDKRTGKMSKYLWRCECMPPNMILSVG